jgi:hypothetical protein
MRIRSLSTPLQIEQKNGKENYPIRSFIYQTAASYNTAGSLYRRQSQLSFKMTCLCLPAFNFFLRNSTDLLIIINSSTKSPKSNKNYK